MSWELTLRAGVSGPVNLATPGWGAVIMVPLNDSKKPSS
jgi:hypothetical protein